VTESQFHVGEWVVPRDGPLVGVPVEILSMKPNVRNAGTKKARTDTMLELRQLDGKTWVFTDDGEFDIVSREEVAST
jgi:hypothetical protein